VPANDVLRLPECVDAHAAAALWHAWQSVTPSVIDCSEVRHVDSAGLALVLCLVDGTSERGKPLPKLRGVPPPMRQLCRAHRVTLDEIA
jgi:ABC-type transporter Mla MlaB component